MITKLKRRFKLATIKRQRHQHKTRLLIQNLDATTRRIDKFIIEESKKQDEFYKRYNITIS